jgi:hypothetical protein
MSLQTFIQISYLFVFSETEDLKMKATLNAERIYIIFEHEAEKYKPEIEETFLFWRKSLGYVQLWCIDGIVWDVLKRDEARFMYE